MTYITLCGQYQNVTQSIIIPKSICFTKHGSLLYFLEGTQTSTIPKNMGINYMTVYAFHPFHVATWMDNAHYV